MSDNLTVLAVFALVIEGIINVVFYDSTRAKLKLWISIAIGIAMTVMWRVGVLAAFGVSIPNIFAEYFDYVITGFFISRGSNAFHTFMLAAKSIYKPTVTTTVTEGTPPADTTTTTTVIPEQ